MKMKAAQISQKIKLYMGSFISLPERLLNQGRSKLTRTHDAIKENITTKKDSLKNWYTSCLRTEPIVLRIPTSFARFSDRAVLRFMKLMQASSNMNTPIIVTIHTMRIGLLSITALR